MSNNIYKGKTRDKLIDECVGIDVQNLNMLPEFKDEAEIRHFYYGLNNERVIKIYKEYYED